jgi:4-aminobutyrate aminotransferase
MRGESEVNFTSRRQAWQDAHLDGTTRSLLAEDTCYFLRQSVSTPCLSAIRRAEGIWIEDVAGRCYMDFHGNNVHHLGYGHPRLIAAIQRQLDELSFAPRRFTCQPAIDLARKLVEISPPGLDKVLFATGGSDAVEIALKIARAATGRYKTVSFWDAFHGAGFGAASVGGEALFRSGPIGPLLPGTEHVAPFACYRCPYGYECDDTGQPRLDLCRLTCARFVRYVLEQEGDVAAFIAEPARATPYIPPPGFWAAVRQACDERGTLLIFDEIPTGLGKTGRLFACEHDGVIPDLLVLGKALGGGVLPIAAVLARADLDVGGAWAFGHYTHEKNPVTCRAALTTLEIIADEGLVENARRQGERALQRLREMRERHPSIGDVRGRGLLLGVELVTDRAAKTPASDVAEAVLYRALTLGLSFKISLGHVLTLTPPLMISDRDLDAALDILELCIAETEQELLLP